MGFIACQAVIGSVLGAAKCTLTLLVFDIYHTINLKVAVSMVVTNWGLASFVGPVFGWWSLSGAGSPSTGDLYKDKLSNSVSTFNYIAAGLSCVALMLTFFLRPIDFAADKYKKNVAEDEI